uniref:Stimulator of interferon genes protein n=1 Tax=Gopherus evgoodei TaxID=1825980 RepID=A0A8C4VTW1_9SAUR
MPKLLGHGDIRGNSANHHPYSTANLHAVISWVVEVDYADDRSRDSAAIPVWTFNRANNNLLKCKETWKLHILLPVSCEIYDDLQKADSHIQYWKDLPALQLDRAGTKWRSYKQSIYTILGEDKKLYYCIVEYAPPLQSLYAMSQDESAAFSREDRLEQAQLFCRTLGEILQHSKECVGCYRLIVYEGEDDSHLLSKEILRHIRQQHLEEYTMCEGNHESTTFLSTEPSILISDSELPRPLRSDGF